MGTFYKQETIQLCPWLLELVISMGTFYKQETICMAIMNWLFQWVHFMGNHTVMPMAIS